MTVVALPRNEEQRDPIAQVKASVRISEYAEQKMGLVPTKRGMYQDWFLCPLHKETTASFHIRFKENDFRCFGCGKGGDVIDLEMAATGETNARVAAERILAEYGVQPEPVKVRPILITSAGPEPLPIRKAGAELDQMLDWLEGRGISASVAGRNPIYPSGKNGIEFRYINEGEVVNRQTRTLSAKGFRFETGKPVIPFGLDDCEGQREVVIVEGVMDKLAVEEATGRTSVLAMPSATPSSECYELACAACADAKRVIVAVDNDEAGAKLRDELVRRLGTHRCAVVDWLDGYKDANDVLLRLGADNLLYKLSQAVDFPVEGVFTIDDSWAAIERLYEEGMPAGNSTGWAHMDRYYTVRRKQLTVITGTPGSGKSVWADALLMNLAQNDWTWKFAVCSPEMQPLERHWSHFISLYANKPFGKGPRERLDRETLRQAKEFIRDKFFQVLPEEPTMEAVIEKFLWTHHRHGVGGLLLDPWNELDHSRPSGMSETEWCNQQLRILKRVGWQHDVAIWLVAHPTKMYRNKQTGKYDIPTLYDISGSAAFYNKCDNGLVIVRDKGDETAPVEVHVQKIRYQEIGGLTGEQPVLFMHDKATGRYWEARR
jgi:twinkle protein